MNPREIWFGLGGMAVGATAAAILGWRQGYKAGVDDSFKAMLQTVDDRASGRSRNSPRL